MYVCGVAITYDLALPLARKQELEFHRMLPATRTLVPGSMLGQRTETVRPP
jgi:hypothetical protein